MRWVLAAPLLAALGCGGDPPIDPPPDAGPPPEGELLLGGSEVSGFGFVELQDYDEVELVSGAQGGFHIWTTMQVRGAAGPLYLRREARLVESGTLILRSLPIRFEVPEEAMEGWWVREEALPSFMCPPPVGITIYDQEIVLTASLTDKSGDTLFAEDNLILIPRCPVTEELSFCERICAD